MEAMIMSKPKVTQILPSIRFGPTLTVDRKLATALIEIVDLALVKNGTPERAMAKNVNPENRFGQSGNHDISPHALAPGRALRAAEFFVSSKEHEIPPPVFRRMLDRQKQGSLPAVAAQLLGLLENDVQPPFAQMRALFLSSDPAVNNFDKTEADDGPEKIWMAQYSSEVMKSHLTQWLRLMDELYKRAGGGSSAPGPSPIEAEVAFVGWLVGYWQGELGLPLSSGRGTPPDDNKHDQQGSFADFVRKAAEIIPPEFRPHSWDHAIRKNLPGKT
jgi:hypothetical protein